MNVSTILAEIADPHAFVHTSTVRRAWFREMLANQIGNDQQAIVLLTRRYPDTPVITERQARINRCAAALASLPI